MKKKYQPRLPEVRTKNINIRVTPWEHEQIRRKAEEKGLSVGAYLLGLEFGFEDLVINVK